MITQPFCTILAIFRVISSNFRNGSRFFVKKFADFLSVSNNVWDLEKSAVLIIIFKRMPQEIDKFSKTY